MSGPDTPVPVIDLDRVERNIAKAQAYCDQHGLRLRPHIKTHKLPVLAHKQLTAGAIGITCQKISEAAVMAASGIDDILLTYNIVSDSKLPALTQLIWATEHLTIALDNDVAVNLAGRAALQAGRELDILVEFESGKLRTGVLTPEQALTLAKTILATKHLNFAGFMTYPVSQVSGDWVSRAKDLFSKHDIPITVFSGGTTPLMWQAHEVAGLTELRPGTYIYHDRATVAAGAATLDECALHVHATVVSTPEPGRAVIDAGSKTLSSDRISPEYGEGYGLVLEYPEAIITNLSEEHGVLDVSACQNQPKIGERVRIVPNHVCVVTNLHDEIIFQRDGVVQGVYPVWARGKTR
jgi:D-serine deaminase-like pyridoxal phosphate-dependent protein